MPRFVGPFLGLVVWLLLNGSLPAQFNPEDKPATFIPRKADTRQELDRQEALKLYGLAAAKERANRLLEATHLYEEAGRLDPRAAAPHKALIPLYLALDRLEDAFVCCRKVLELNPNDHETGYLYARQLRAHNRPQESLSVLAQVSAMPKLKERADLRAQVYHDLGVLYEGAEDWDKAQAAFASLVEILEKPAALLEHTPYTREEIDLQAAETYERLGRCCLKAKQPAAAIRAFERAGKKDPSRSARLSLNMAEVYVSQGKRREAIEQLDAYLGTQPQSMDGYELKIKLQRELGQEREVLPGLEACSNRDPHNNALKLLLAREYGRAERRAEAQKVYDHLIERDAFGPEVFRGLFELYRSEGERGAEKILDRLNKAIKAGIGKDGEDDKKPGDPAQAARARSMLLVLRDDAELVKLLLPVAHARLLSDRDREQRLAYQTRSALAVLAARTRQLDRAEELYRSCLEGEGPGDAAEQEAYFGLLRVLWQAHKTEAIVEICRKGLKTAGNTTRVLFYLDLAQALMSLDKVAEALEAIDEGVKVAGEQERLMCRRSRAELLAQAERYEQAIAECQDLLKEYNLPGDVRDIRHTLSGVYSMAHDAAGSEEQLQKILEADSNDATACNDLGYQWADQNKNLEEAEKLIRKALDLERRQRLNGTKIEIDADQDNAAFVDSLGWVLFRRGNLSGAFRELERASKMPGGDDDPVVWDHLGDVQARQGRTEEARKSWRKAVQLYESGRRRRADERYHEIKQKLRADEP